MTRRRDRWLPLTVLVAALAVLVASIVWVAGSDIGRPGPTAMTGAVPGHGPVRNLDDAERAAGRFADRWDLRVGEVMEFSNGYYAELRTPGGKGATEVLIDPDNGVVQLEFGPAMMWNTAYGMMPARDRTGATTVEPRQAVRIADRWLREHHPDLHAASPEAFPGYYTLHTLRGDDIVGMLSVNARTGAVWDHTWHGRFIQMQEHPEPR
ncbi:hypothetical protein [Streptomyces sp. NPDC059175]|uniref:hypothetical protein n=1 Tax=unclassified Streptomyces TaxID=2593676 RepID=UPI00368DE163